jgi:predicted metalloprotease
MDFDSGDSADTSQVEDRRGQGGLRGGVLGAGAGGLGIVGVIIALITTLAGGGGGSTGGLGDILGSLSQAGSSQVASGAPAQPIDNSCEGKTSATDNPTFITCVVNNVQNYWTGVFSHAGQTYRPARLVLFGPTTNSGCGTASAETGPFYCPPDEKVYLDLGFFEELSSRFGAKGGDFAEAYVVAHEYGHHLQNLLGIEAKMRDLQAQSPSKANEYSVRLELQADCFAGVWGNGAFEAGKVAKGEVAIALDAAAAVGDDRIQKAATGRVNPESFTHGTSAQRQKWFNVGFDTGNPDACDTFSKAI